MHITRDEIQIPKGIIYSDALQLCCRRVWHGLSCVRPSVCPYVTVRDKA